MILKLTDNQYGLLSVYRINVAQLHKNFRKLKNRLTKVLQMPMNNLSLAMYRWQPELMRRRDCYQIKGVT